MNAASLSFARFLHRSPSLRRLARRIGRTVTISQPFHGGTIYLDAVDHSWSWTGGRPLETFDRELQDHLLTLVRPRGRLIDVGCNVGVMSLSVLLRDPRARAVCVDPNRRALHLLDRSLRRNGSADRAQLVGSAVSAGETHLSYDQEGSFTGHVDAAGAPVPAIPLLQLLATHATQPAVLNIDTEGYEVLLADSLARARPPAGSVAVIELHPLGFNGIGNPAKVLETLKTQSTARLALFDRMPLENFDPTRFHQLEMSWAE